jgi:hypothetical protein
MTNYNINFVPCFPKDILSDVRQSEIKKSTDDPRRMLEKMYAEAFSNFRKLIEGNVSQKRGREILAFFRENRINVTLESFTKASANMRFSSPVISGLLEVKSTRGVILLCKILDHPLPKSFLWEPEEPEIQKISPPKNITEENTDTLLQAEKKKGLLARIMRR